MHSSFPIAPPAYLMWLMLDLLMFYAGEKLKPGNLLDRDWNMVIRGSGPDVVRPPDMYTMDLQHEWSFHRPRWSCSQGHWLELNSDGVFRCDCEKV